MMPFSPEDYPRNQTYIRTLVEGSSGIKPEWRKDIKYGRTQQGNIVGVEYTGDDPAAKEAIKKALTAQNQSIKIRDSSSRPNQIFYIDEVVRPDQSRRDDSNNDRLVMLGAKEIVFRAADTLPPDLKASIDLNVSGICQNPAEVNPQNVQVALQCNDGTKARNVQLKLSENGYSARVETGNRVIITAPLNAAFVPQPKAEQKATPAPARDTRPVFEPVTEANQQAFSRLIQNNIRKATNITFADNDTPARMIVTFNNEADCNEALWNSPGSWKLEKDGTDPKIMYFYAAPSESLNAVSVLQPEPEQKATPPVLEPVTAANQQDFTRLIKNKMPKTTDITFAEKLMTDNVASTGMILKFATKDERDIALQNAPNDWQVRRSESNPNVMYVFAVSAESLKAAPTSAPAPQQPARAASPRAASPSSSAPYNVVKKEAPTLANARAFSDQIKILTNENPIIEFVPELERQSNQQKIGEKVFLSVPDSILSGMRVSFNSQAERDTVLREKFNCNPNNFDKTTTESGWVVRPSASEPNTLYVFEAPAALINPVHRNTRTGAAPQPQEPIRRGVIPLKHPINKPN
jgi:hypothetical protein